MKAFKLKEKLWIYPGQTAAWHFMSINKKISREIKETFGKHHKGFGSIRVEAKIGKTIWKTSIFPSKEGIYLLPVKAEVRKKEGISAGDAVNLTINI